MSFQQMTSQLQSRIAIRGNAIRQAEEWKKVHRVQEQMKDWRDCKAVIKQLASDQILDRKLLRMAQEAAYMDVLMSPVGRPADAVAQDVDFWEDSYND